MNHEVTFLKQSLINVFAFAFKAIKELINRKKTHSPATVLFMKSSVKRRCSASFLFAVQVQTCHPF